MLTVKRKFQFLRLRACGLAVVWQRGSRKRVHQMQRGGATAHTGGVLEAYREAHWLLKRRGAYSGVEGGAERGHWGELWATAEPRYFVQLIAVDIITVEHARVVRNPWRTRHAKISLITLDHWASFYGARLPQKGLLVLRFLF